MKKSTKPVQSIVHEINPAGQHRIVKFRNGVPSASPWFEHHQIAVFGLLRASVHGSSAFPVGVFRVLPTVYEQI